MEILIAGEADIEELAEVEISTKIKSIPRHITGTEIDYTKRLERWQSYFKAKLPQTSRPERIVFKAVENNRIVGYVAGHLSTRFNMEAEIQSFYILKEFQKQGTGTRLFAEFIKWLNDRNVKSLCVGISSGNEYQAFYLKNGGQHLNPHWICWHDVAGIL